MVILCPAVDAVKLQLLLLHVWDLVIVNELSKYTCTYCHFEPGVGLLTSSLKVMAGSYQCEITISLLLVFAIGEQLCQSNSFAEGLEMSK